jgi:hypothetical protein
MPKRLDIDTESLVRLKRAGVAEHVILAVVECALANSNRGVERAVPAVLLGMNP